MNNVFLVQISNLKLKNIAINLNQFHLEFYSMINQFKETFTLDNFEGPLDFLLHLIQKNEIEIKDISIADIIDQFLLKWKEQLDKQIDSKSEFISHASFLLWLKSKSLLPRSEEESLENQEMDPHFEIIHQLIEYCHIKQDAKGLALLEQKQNSFFLSFSRSS